MHKETLCMVAGGLLLLASVGLYGGNCYADAAAGAKARTIVEELQQSLPERTAPSVCASGAEEEVRPELPEEPDEEPPVAEVDGNVYLGELSIPILGLRLPVMSEWSYPRLRAAPCRQFGSVRTGDLVIAAHNYASHFGRLSTLAQGNEVVFTELDGVENHYAVDRVEVLEPDCVEEVQHSGSPLVLYTCTYGGRHRVAVFCDRKG